ncbi:hypothetical protein [Streptomyces sp. NPDC020141]|uniref:hypothetical protein n=1 Tax=Streptomyces sp. NPDC020141 TaxID=3365065 RepID=UPI0037944D92
MYQAAGDIYIDGVPRGGSGPGLLRLSLASAFFLLGVLLALKGLVGHDSPERTVLVGLGATCAAGGLLALSSSIRRWRRSRRYTPGRVRRLEHQLADAAEYLTRELLAQGGREERLRRLQHPSPLSVRWDTADDLSDHWANVRGRDEADTPLDLSGDFPSIGDVFAAVPSRRLILLGPVGAGKSALALHFALGRLRSITAEDAIPVILSPVSWDPRAESLAAWAARRLALDHPALARRTVADVPVASELLFRGRLLPILDGFDEMPVELRPEALRRLRDELGRGEPLIMTSREDEYRAAVDTAHTGLPGAAAVRLRPLGAADIIGYLRRTATKTIAEGRPTTRWDPVLEAIRHPGDSPRPVQARLVREALSTPLMVSLARTAYSATAREPAELLDGRRFPTPSAIEEHLLDQLIPSVTDRPERMTRGLTFLARRLGSLGTQDLAWWNFGGRAPRAIATLGLALPLAGASALMRWLFPDLRISWFGAVLPLWLTFAMLCPLPLAQFAADSRRREATPVPRCFERPESLARLLLVKLGIIPPIAVYLWWLSGFPLPAAVAVYVAVVAVVLHPRVQVATAQSPPRMLRQDRAATLASMGLVNIATRGPAVWMGAVLMLLPVAVLGYWQSSGGRDHSGTVHWAVAMGGAAGAIAVCGMSLSAWGGYTAARVGPWAAGMLPWDVVDFLDDAHQRGVLRRSGGFYQFRHARLQERLASSDESEPTGRTGGPVPGRAPLDHEADGTRLLLPSAFAVGLVGLLFGMTRIPGVPGPYTALPPGCELLDRSDVSAALSDPERATDFLSADPVADCAWVSGEDGAGVVFRARVHRPVPGRSAAEVAEVHYETELPTGEPRGPGPPSPTEAPSYEPPTAFTLPEAPRNVDETATRVDIPGPHPLIVTVVRAGNVVLTISYDGQAGDRPEDAYPRLARISHDLAVSAARKLPG